MVNREMNDLKARKPTIIKGSLIKKPLPLMAGFLIQLVFLVAGCDGIPGQPDAAIKSQESMSWDGEAFALFAQAPNPKGLRNLNVVDHTGGVLEAIEQQSPRRFVAQKSREIGFHPGVITQWPTDPKLALFAGEGTNSLTTLSFDQGYREIATLKEEAPRYITTVDWPGWGKTVAVTPFKNGYIVLLRDFDPMTAHAAERVIVPLAESMNTIRASDRITVGDLDGDGIKELVIVVSATGEVIQIKYPGPDANAKPSMTILFKDDQWGMPNEAQLFDLDDDGDLDMVLPDEAKPGKINLLMNDGRGHMTPGAPLDFPHQEGVTELRIAKDKDGLAYILAAGYKSIALYQRPMGWRPGSPMPYHAITWSNDLALDMLLEDIEGDGWLDGVVGRFMGKKNVWVVYGPLWDRFKKLSESNFVLQ